MSEGSVSFSSTRRGSAYSVGKLASSELVTQHKPHPEDSYGKCMSQARSEPIASLSSVVHPATFRTVTSTGHTVTAVTGHSTTTPRSTSPAGFFDEDVIKTVSSNQTNNLKGIGSCECNQFTHLGPRFQIGISGPIVRAQLSMHSGIEYLESVTFLNKYSTTS